MTASSAAEYADSLINEIRLNTENGTPFGINEETETYDDVEPGGEFSAYDYLSDVLDIQYLVTADRQYRAARILIAFGGPSAWIDTNSRQLEAAWWSATEYRDLPSEFCDALDEALESLWDCN